MRHVLSGPAASAGRHQQGFAVSKSLWGCALLFSLAVAPSVAMSAESSPPAPRKAAVYGHRGASALLPEHTLAAYAQAIADGADYIEPDLVMTRDGVLVSRHENEISGTTDVATHPEFADRKTTKTIDGERVEGWFTEDFTLAELKTLYARERLPQLRSTAFDGQFRIATLDEIITFLVQQAGRAGRGIGLVPEIKHGTYFNGIGLPMEDLLVKTLQANPYTRVAPVTIQSFEVGNLRYLRTKLGRDSNIRLLQLLGDPKQQSGDVLAAKGSQHYVDMITPAGLDQIAGYADGIGPSLRLVIPLEANGRLGPPTSLVRDAHAVGLMVVPYTFRPENAFMAAEFRKGEPNARNPEGSVAEMRAYLATGIDAFFTDDPALGRRAVDGNN
jgi:glycerophosphoryl diester phosphodiesterase